MRVLHIVESFAAGVLTSVTQLCNLQAGDGYDVFLACSIRPGTPADYHRFLQRQVKIVEIDLVRRISPGRDLRGLFKIRKLILAVAPDIVHLHSSKAGFLGRLAVFCGAKKRAQTFYSPRGFSFLQANVSATKRRLYFGLERLALLFGGTIVACSRGEAEAAAKLKARRVVVLENAVDIEKVPLKIKSEERAGPVQVGTLGRICPQKNPALFKKLAAAFVQRDDMRFVWVGGGEGQPELAGLSNLRITGWLPRDKALEQLSRLDIYVQTSLWEGMPVSLIEAQAAGLPAVVSDVPGNRDIVVHGETGFIAGGAEDFARFIHMLGQDQALRLSMGERARRQARRRFSLQRLQEEINRLYGGAPAGAGPAR